MDICFSNQALIYFSLFLLNILEKGEIKDIDKFRKNFCDFTKSNVKIPYIEAITFIKNENFYDKSENEKDKILQLFRRNKVFEECLKFSEPSQIIYNSKFQGNRKIGNLIITNAVYRVRRRSCH